MSYVGVAVSVGVYVHFPWCLKKCPYCDFNSYGTQRDDIPHQRYADAVIRELEWHAERTSSCTLTSIFLGGGTPSLWEASALGRVLDEIKSCWTHAADLEITVECNPTSIDRERALALLDVGVSRFSIGVQSLDDQRLRYLGRLHDREGALVALEEVVSVASRVSADLMFGMPEQKAEDLEREIDRVVQTGVEHVSAYALTIEPGTQFGELHRRGRLPMAVEDEVVSMFLRAEARLAEHGFAHYEVSNYARPGAEARHNLHYWRGGDYIGAGAGAVGCTREPDGHSWRWRSEPNPERYLDVAGSAEGVAWDERLTPDDRVREAIMLGLRTHEGVDLEQVWQRTGRDPRVGREPAIARRLERSELEVTARGWRVPPRHWLMLDSIVSALF